MTITTRTTTYLVETRTQRTPLRARRAPSLVGGARICFEGRRHERKERLLVPEGSLRWREGRRLCLEERRHGRKERFSCQKDVFADGRGAVSA